MKKIIIFFIFLIIPINCLASTIVIDMENNRVLWEHNSNEKKLIASTTKIMTAILAIESNKLENIVTVGDEVLKMYGSNIYIERNEHILLLDLVYGLMLRSGNDAAIVIANYIGGSEEKFIEKMNEKAKEIGMTNTIFNNPHGLDEDTKNYSTAYDLSLLYSYAYKNNIFKQIVGTKNYITDTDLKTYNWTNRNKLLFYYDKSTGGKTGYTPKAGRILVSSAVNNLTNICIVTFNYNSYLYDYHQATYEDIFSKYKNYLILDKDNFYLDNYDKNVYIKKSYYSNLTENEYNSITIKTKKNKKINKGIFGEVYVYLDDDILYKDIIYIKENKQNIFQRIKTFLFNKLVFK